MFKDAYRNKKVLVTGHTGFKGSWLTSWLIELGAEVVGVAKDIPTAPSLFEELKLEKTISHHQVDIRDLSKIKNVLANEKPDFIFHLAAQPLVSLSFSDPIETITSNVVGTTNVLEALRLSNHKCIAIIITSDKAYENVEQVWGYKESDRMGGKDIYSGSKGAAELIINSYFHSFFAKSDCNVKLAVGRAGNVIGGGDWARDRIVVDCMQAWSVGKTVEIRAPLATRPWQHVLEPLSGYLLLGTKLMTHDELHGEAFNFGPDANQLADVETLVKDLSNNWRESGAFAEYTVQSSSEFKEAGLLKLTCDKALALLNWQATLNYAELVDYTSSFYRQFYKSELDVKMLVNQQISSYADLAAERDKSWTE